MRRQQSLACSQDLKDRLCVPERHGVPVCHEYLARLQSPPGAPLLEGSRADRYGCVSLSDLPATAT